MSQFIKFIIVSQNYSVYWVYAQVSGNFRGHLMTTKAEPAKRVCIFGIRKTILSRLYISVFYFRCGSGERSLVSIIGLARIYLQM